MPIPERSAFQATLDGYAAVQKLYTPNIRTTDQVTDTSMFMLVGPSAMGKTTVMTAVLEQDDRFGIVSTTTSRPDNRPSEGGKIYKHIPHTPAGVAPLLAKIDAREVVQYSIIPGTRHIYATEPEDYNKPFMMLDTQSRAVAALQAVPFKQALVVGVISNPSIWRIRFQDRWLENRLMYKARRTEAIESLSWLLDQPNSQLRWLNNSYTKPEVLGANFIRIAEGGFSATPYREGREIAKACLEAAWQKL